MKQKCFCAVKLQTFCQKIKIKPSALLVSASSASPSPVTTVKELLGAVFKIK